MTNILTSLHGRELGLDKDRYLTGPKGIKFPEVWVGASGSESQIFNGNNNGSFGSGTTTVFGGGSGTFPEEGNLFRTALSSASAISPAATNADNVLAVYTIPASSLDVAGRGISVQAMGLFAANTRNKDCKIIWNPSTAVVGSTIGSGGTTVADTGVSTASGVGWELTANIFKLAAANTQYAQETGAVVGTSHGGCGVPLYPTATESAAILIAITGNASSVGGALADITLNFVEVNVMN